MDEFKVGDTVTATYNESRYTGRITGVIPEEETAYVTMAPGVMMVLGYENLELLEEGTVEETMTKAEQRDAVAVSADPDLMIRAREFADMRDLSRSVDEVLDHVHENYEGGITQFYLANRF